MIILQLLFYFIYVEMNLIYFDLHKCNTVIQAERKLLLVSLQTIKQQICTNIILFRLQECSACASCNFYETNK